LHYLDYIQPLKGGKHKHTPRPPSLSHINNLPSPGRVTNCHTPMNIEFLVKDVILIKVPCQHQQLYPRYLIHARILSGHTFSTLQSVPGSLISEHIIRDLSLFVCPHRLCFSGLQISDACPDRMHGPCAAAQNRIPMLEPLIDTCVLRVPDLL
jgi:hypothetical protein